MFSISLKKTPMSDTKPLPPVSVLHSLFEIRGGDLVRKKSGRGRCYAGDIVSSRTQSGYVRVSIDGSHYLVHRIIYAMVRGPIPDGLNLDHINGVRHDNRIENLRLVTHQENAFNYVSAAGFRFDEQRMKFVAFIKRDGKTKTLGHFNSATAARAAYVSAKATFHQIQPR